MKKMFPYILILLCLMVFTISYATAEIKNVNTIAFSKEKPLTEFKLPESLRIIEDEVFVGTAIVRIELPENVANIGERAFAMIPTLRVVQFPIATERIASTAFTGSSFVTIYAAPNSYARSFAKSQRLPFLPIETFYAKVLETTNLTVVKASQLETIEVDSFETQELNNQWCKLEQTRVIGTLDIIYNSIQGRGPPIEQCENMLLFRRII